MSSMSMAFHKPLQWLLAASLILHCTAFLTAVNGPVQMPQIKVTGSSSNSTDLNTLRQSVSRTRNSTSPGSSGTTSGHGRHLNELPAYVAATRQNIITDTFRAPEGKDATYYLYAYSSDCLGLDDYAHVGNYTDSNGNGYSNATIDTITSDLQSILDHADNFTSAAKAFNNHTAFLYKQASAIGKDILDHVITHTSTNDHLNFMRKKDTKASILIDTELTDAGNASVSLDFSGDFRLEGAEWEEFLNRGNDTTPVWNEWRKAFPTAAADRRISRDEWWESMARIYVTYFLYYFADDAAARWGAKAEEEEGAQTFVFLATLSNVVNAASLVNVLRSFRAEYTRGTLLEDLDTGATAETERGGEDEADWPFRTSAAIYKKWWLVHAVKKEDDTSTESSWDYSGDAEDAVEPVDDSWVRLKFENIPDDFATQHDVCS